MGHSVHDTLPKILLMFIKISIIIEIESNRDCSEFQMDFVFVIYLKVKRLQKIY